MLSDISQTPDFIKWLAGYYLKYKERKLGIYRVL